MTKQQIAAFSKRINAKIKRQGLSARPLSEDQKRQLDEVRQRLESKRQDSSRAVKIA